MYHIIDCPLGYFPFADQCCSPYIYRSQLRCGWDHCFARARPAGRDVAMLCRYIDVKGLQHNHEAMMDRY
ncbi:hypothetical protein OUZ56_031312 [Daphnia magna]|uniref:Uncharacterized protein n=1 Tax=Daphnia magna TaxID=35525 RepID=A0ABQ9ZU98_9CRUS|nr:hypothetical protein OUZ56_031312 [Daphnia magna]